MYPSRLRLRMEHLPTVAWSSWRDVTSKDTVDARPTRERVAIPAKRTGDVCAMHVFGNSTYTLRVEIRNQHSYWFTSFCLGFFFLAVNSKQIYKIWRTQTDGFVPLVCVLEQPAGVGQP